MSGLDHTLEPVAACAPGGGHQRDRRPASLVGGRQGADRRGDAGAGRGGVGGRAASWADAAAGVRLAPRKRGEPATAATMRMRRGSCRRWWKQPLPEPVRDGSASRDAPGRTGDATGIIEMEIDGVTVRVGRGAEAKTVAAVIRALKAGAVIGPTGAVRVMVATRPVDFRKGAEGLAALVRETMQADPFSGAVYVFRAKRADRVKLVFWDGTGVCLFAKRLEDGKFRWPNDAGWRDAAVGRAALGAAGRARLAAGSRGARDTGAGCSRADLRHK